MMRTRTTLAASAALAATIAVGALTLPGMAVGAQDETPADDTATTSAPSSRSTAEVQRQTLRSSDEFNADLGFGESRTLVSGAEGILTWLPADETVIQPGDILWEVDRQPVPYLDGAIPMYRDLFWGVTKGDDVEQLERVLIELGYGPDGWEADTTFNRTTRNAVKEFQKAFGMTDDGILGQAEIVFGTEAIRVADTAHVGDATSAGPILTITPATAEVTLSSSSRQLATFQESPIVVIVLADGTELDATLDEVKATPADEEGRFGYRITYDVVDAVTEPQPVKVKIEKVLAEDALTVPVDALIALTEGGYAVEVVTGGSSVLRAVEVIDFDDTQVAITGDVAEGDQVVVP